MQQLTNVLRHMLDATCLKKRMLYTRSSNLLVQQGAAGYPLITAGTEGMFPASLVMIRSSSILT